METIAKVIDLPPVEISWVWRVQDAAVGQPMNMVTLHRLRSLDEEIRRDAVMRGGETIDHVEAMMTCCAYRMQMMCEVENQREAERERARREGRIRYVD